MTPLHDEAPTLDPQEPEQDFTICRGEDLPHHDCQSEERKEDEF
jgi:hypothetical protein